MSESIAALRSLLAAELNFKRHLEAIYARVIQPLKSNFQVCHKIHPKSTLAGLLEISTSRGPLHSCFKRILGQLEPETFESDSELSIRQYADYVDIMIETIKNWSLVGLPEFLTVWSRQRANPTIRQALIDIGDHSARWNLTLHQERNWIDMEDRLDVFSTCVLPFEEETESAHLALVARNKLEALDHWIRYQSNTKDLIRQTQILAIEYLIYDCPILLADRSRKFEKAAIFQLTMSSDAGLPEKALVVAFNDILIWADFESKFFTGGIYRTNVKVSQDILNPLTICLQIDSKETVVKLQSSESQQHEEWIRYLDTKQNSALSIELPRRYSLLNRFPPQTLPVEVRIRSESDDSINVTEEILVRDGDHPSKLAYLFARRHQLTRSLTNELCFRLHSVTESRCEDIKARRRLYRSDTVQI